MSMNPLDNLDEKLKGYVLDLDPVPIDVYDPDSVTKRSDAIRNVSQFFKTREYEQVLPSSISWLDAVESDPTSFNGRSLAVCIDDSFSRRSRTFTSANTAQR